MRSKPTDQELEAFVQRNMATLPDSLRARKAALVTLLWLLPRNYAGRHGVGEALRGLHIHERAQARFQFSGNGDGDGKGGKQ